MAKYCLNRLSQKTVQLFGEYLIFAKSVRKQQLTFFRPSASCHRTQSPTDTYANTFSHAKTLSDSTRHKNRTPAVPWRAKVVQLTCESLPTRTGRHAYTSHTTITRAFGTTKGESTLKSLTLHELSLRRLIGKGMSEPPPPPPSRLLHVCYFMFVAWWDVQLNYVWS